MKNPKLDILEEKIREGDERERLREKRQKERIRGISQEREIKLRKARDGFNILCNIAKISQIIKYSNKNLIQIPKYSDCRIQIREGKVYIDDESEPGFRTTIRKTMDELEDGYYIRLLCKITEMGREKTLDYILNDILRKENRIKLPTRSRGSYL